MAKEYSFDMYGQPSLKDPKERKFNVYFSEPEGGITEKTGIALFIAGFGGHANSNVYKKMRNTFADKYNLVTVQCDYFGWEFMQESNNISSPTTKMEIAKHFKEDEVEYIFQDDFISTRLMEVASKYGVNVTVNESLGETPDNYCDMGLIQAMDNIAAIQAVIAILKDNGYDFNQEKVILYGHSQGAYLSYLCNAFAPDLFSLLIDNSAWLFPVYLKSDRYLSNRYGDSVLTTRFDYLAKELGFDEGILSLPSLYRKFDNNCNIVCYHGTNDNLITHTDKAILKKITNNFEYHEIGPKNVDGKIFKSTGHGLDADFLELFDYTMNNYKKGFKKNPYKNKNKETDKVLFETSRYSYCIDYSGGVPVLNVQEK